MPTDFDSDVLSACMDTFARPFTLLPIVSQGTGAPPVRGQGIMTTRGSNFMLDDGAIFSDHTTTLGIRLSEWPIRPVKDDHILLEAADWPTDAAGISLCNPGEYYISDAVLDRQGGLVLTIREFDGAAPIPITPPAYPPTVTGISPSSGPETGGTTVDISGQHFTGATAVKFGANAAGAFTVINDGTITAVNTPANSGSVDVIVVTPNGASIAVIADRFTFVAVPEAPRVVLVAPDSGPETGNTSVTISGGNFTGANKVNFGGNPAKTFTIVNDTTITAVSPAGTGIVDVTVSSSFGTSAINLTDQFTYV